MNTKRRLIVFALLALLAVRLPPYRLFHEHKTSRGAAFHNSSDTYNFLSFSNRSKPDVVRAVLNICDHKYHIEPKIERCDLCGFEFISHFEYLPSATFNILPVFLEFGNFPLLLLHTRACFALNNKSPPFSVFFLFLTLYKRCQSSCY